MASGNGSDPPKALDQETKDKLAELPKEKLVEGVVELTKLLAVTVGRMVALQGGISLGCSRPDLIQRLMKIRSDTQAAHEAVCDNLCIMKAKALE
jgi:hypothetical protein